MAKRRLILKMVNGLLSMGLVDGRGKPTGLNPDAPLNCRDVCEYLAEASPTGVEIDLDKLTIKPA